ncbi:CDP-alcohol phosphatidyltransferase family protein [Jidongwangia harbinensis]|uniref:CDP-alcohol phosphatidyltransferase family protein n=1 Tax=Jidongwangia harbinensis TaxID=2878561 RepID=UPI001CD948FE|nr:CDP-alcohol phosphatidyltransferase family protein [Jidongwangia harbinensis]MCA2219138.1 CDP-alcohol phosphatidyltransferase family protein [Jidongwangia harbinensis]
MAQRFTLHEIRTRTYKDRDAWWTVWLVDPLASRLVWLVAPLRSVTPNRLTVSAFLLGVGAAACFWQQSYAWLALGALLFHFSFVIDCMDGKIARLKGTGSVFGAWLDYVFDRLRVLVCTVALMGGQYVRTEDFVYVWLAGLVIFLDMFRYLNALQMGKVKGEMRARLAAARGVGSAPPVFVEEAVAHQPVGNGTAVLTSTTDMLGRERPVVDVYGDFRNRFGAFVKIRNTLVRQRIRAHVISGIEFQMAVFIIGPLVHQIVGTTLVAAALLVAFELLLIYKLWTATRSYVKHLAEAGVGSEAEADAAVEAVGLEPSAVVDDPDELIAEEPPAAPAVAPR